MYPSVYVSVCLSVYVCLDGLASLVLTGSVEVFVSVFGVYIA